MVSIGPRFTAEEYKGRQCLCANNDLHDEGQCQNVATQVGVLEQADVMVYACDECAGPHIQVTESWEEV